MQVSSSRSPDKHLDHWRNRNKAKVGGWQNRITCSSSGISASPFCTHGWGPAPFSLALPAIGSWPSWPRLWTAFFFCGVSRQLLTSSKYLCHSGFFLSIPCHLNLTLYFGLLGFFFTYICLRSTRKLQFSKKKQQCKTKANKNHFEICRFLGVSFSSEKLIMKTLPARAFPEVCGHYLHAVWKATLPHELPFSYFLPAAQDPPQEDPPCSQTLCAGLSPAYLTLTEQSHSFNPFHWIFG